MGALDDLILNAVLKEKKVGRTFNDYDSLKTYLSKRFLSGETGCTARLNFRVISQQANESPDDYLTKLLGLAKDGYDKLNGETITELVLQKFCDGIRDPTIRLKLLEHDPQTLEDALAQVKTLQKLKSYSEALEIDKGRNNSSNTASDAANVKVAAVNWKGNYERPFNRGNSNFNNKNGPTPVKYRCTSSGKPICNYCGGVNHLERNCFKKHRQVGTYDRYEVERGREVDRNLNKTRRGFSPRYENRDSDRSRSASRSNQRHASYDREFIRIINNLYLGLTVEVSHL